MSGTMIKIESVEELGKGGALPEIAYVRGDLCFVRITPKTKAFPLEVKFAFRPPSSIEWADIRAEMAKIHAEKNDEARKQLDNQLGAKLLKDHLKLWDFNRGEGVVPLDAKEFERTPSAITGFIAGCILDSAVAVEGLEKKSDGSSASLSGTQAGLN